MLHLVYFKLKYGFLEKRYIQHIENNNTISYVFTTYSSHWMFHGDIDKCSYVKSDVMLRKCPAAEVHDAFLLHGTSVCFNKQISSSQQKLHIRTYVLSPNKQKSVLFVV